MKYLKTDSPIRFLLLFICACLISPVLASVTSPDTSSVTIRLSFVGDIMCHTSQFLNAQTGTDSYDFNPSFSEVKEWLETDDLTVGNFETVCAGPDKEYSGYPAFNTPDEIVTALKNNGFDFLVTANNHSMDMHEKGLKRTARLIDSIGLGRTGTFLSREDHDSVRVINLKGIPVAILNYSYGSNEFYPCKEHSFMLNLIDTASIGNDISAAREAGAEIVIVFYHYGQEMYSDETSSQEAVIDKTIKAGADIVIGSHPHVIGKTRSFKTSGGTLDSGFVATSMGNFYSNQYWRYTDAGMILQLELTKAPESGTRISDIRYLPTWVYRGTNSGMKKHIIYPAERAASDTTLTWLDMTSRKMAEEAFHDTRAMLERPGVRLLRISEPICDSMTISISFDSLMQQVNRLLPDGNTYVVMLGSGNPNPDPHQSGCSIAIVVNDVPYIVDFGPGLVRKAAALSPRYGGPVKGLTTKNLKHAFLTHLHSDHTTGYPDLIFTPWVMGRDEPLEVYGPKGTNKLTKHILKAYNADIQYRLEGEEPANDVGWRVNSHEFSKEGVIFQDTNVTVEAFPVDHGSWPNAWGFRFTTPDKVIVISGDTKPSEKIIEYATNADILIHEVYFHKSWEMKTADWKIYHQHHHTSTVEVGEIAAQAKPKLVILYHVLEWGGTETEILDEVHSVYDGEVVLGKDLDIY
ncbi:CapA family protein [Bacteroidota bacterium]